MSYSIDVVCEMDDWQKQLSDLSDCFSLLRTSRVESVRLPSRLYTPFPSFPLLDSSTYLPSVSPTSQSLTAPVSPCARNRSWSSHSGCLAVLSADSLVIRG